MLFDGTTTTKLAQFKYEQVVSVLGNVEPGRITYQELRVFIAVYRLYRDFHENAASSWEDMAAERDSVTAFSPQLEMLLKPIETVMTAVIDRAYGVDPCEAHPDDTWIEEGEGAKLAELYEKLMRKTLIVAWPVFWKAACEEDEAMV
jgi:hypothetical protein